MNRRLLYIFSLLLILSGRIFVVQAQDGTLVIGLYQKAQGYFQQNKFELASEEIRKAVNLLHEIPSDSLKGLIYASAGDIYCKAGKQDEALRYFLRSADSYQKLADSSSLSGIQIQIAHVYFQLEAFEKSLEYFDLAMKNYPYTSSDFNFWSSVQEFRAASFFRLKDYGRAEENYVQLLDQYETKGLTDKTIATLQNVADVLGKQKKYADVITIHRKMISIFIAKAQPQRIAEISNNIGYNHVLLGDFQEAKLAFLNAVKLLSSGNYSPDFKATLYANIGICYQNTGDVQNAKTYLMKSLKIRVEEQNPKELAIINNIIALTYFRSDDLFNALEYSQEAVDAAEKSGDANLMSQNYKTYSTLLQATEDHEKALKIYSKHLLIQDSLLRSERQEREKLDERILELEKSEKELKLKIADENVKDILLEQLRLKQKQQEQENEILKNKNQLQESEKLRIEQSLLLEKQRNEAFKRSKEMEALEQEKQLKEKELQLQVAKEKEQAKAYELLKTEKEKQQLELQKQELTLEKQAERQKRFGWMMSLALIIIALAVFTLVHTKKKNRELKFQKNQIELKNNELNTKNEEIQAQAEHLQEANAELTAKNEEISAQRDELHEKNIKIEEQSTQIISSIHYAKRIQEAVLPEDENLVELLPSHFVFFKPRDIVSGDFYWVKQLQKFIYVAVADCTGHGVPGAFMSMLGTAFLNEITGQGETMLPSEILNALREKVKKSLKQTGKSGEAKDGMDMVLIRIDLESRDMIFSGAHNSIIHLRENQETHEPMLTYLKGDKMPIGISRREDSFSDQRHTLLHNDMIYLYTDGYIDQFGGPKKMKFMSSGFKTFLQEIYTKPVSEQRILLEMNIENWRGKLEQIDDMLVIGIHFTDDYGVVELF